MHDIQFTKGINVFIYWFSMLFFIAMGIAALLVAFAALIPYGIFIILMTIYLGFRLKKHFSKNKSGTYNPNEIPIELLP